MLNIKIYRRVLLIGRYAEERSYGETFISWLERSGGAKAIGATLKDLDEFPDPDANPDFYVDYGETGPYEAVIGESECAS